MSAAHPLCDECNGTGWILYRSETVDSELEEAYHLFPNCCISRYCMGISKGYLSPAPVLRVMGLGTSARSIPNSSAPMTI